MMPNFVLEKIEEASFQEVWRLRSMFATVVAELDHEIRLRQDGKEIAQRIAEKKHTVDYFKVGYPASRELAPRILLDSKKQVVLTDQDERLVAVQQGVLR